MAKKRMDPSTREQAASLTLNPLNAPSAAPSVEELTRARRQFKISGVLLVLWILCLAWIALTT